MPENSYISRFTGQQIDAAIQKSTDISKTAGEINTSLTFIDNSQTNLATAKEGEILSKDANGALTGTGIVNEADKIFFPKDGRFPSGSIDVGPGITLSENGGWLQDTPHTLDKTYIIMDYEVDKTGTQRPIYWQRSAEETNVIIQGVDTSDMTLNTFSKQPSIDEQVNALYLNFANAYNNVIIEIKSLNTNKPIKYIPNENAWRTGEGGISVNQGVNNILNGITPISLLTAYNIQFNIKTPVTLKGNGITPYIAIDRQLITQKGVLLQGEGTGSADTAEQVRDKLATLTGDSRLDATHIKNIPSGGGGGSSTLLGLTDTPDSYAGKAGTIVRVNNAETGIEFDLPPDFALPDLSNVKSADLKKESVKAGMLQQDLEDVDLNKLKEKVDAAGANLITVGELHGEYHQGDVKEMQFHNDLEVTIDTQNKVATISLSQNMKDLPGQYTDLKAEVDRIQTNIGDKVLPTYTYRGNAMPTLPVDKQKAYYVSFNALKDSLQVLQLPANVDDGTIFSIDNNDANDSLFIQPQHGETINNLAGNRKINAESILFLIKKGTNWAIGFDGYMPNTMDRMMTDIKAELTGSLNTIEEIKAQLKDRLHLFSEIQTEFNDQLHSFDAIEAEMIKRGFSVGSSIAYGYSDTPTLPQNNNWVQGYMAPNEDVLIPSNSGNKYLMIYLPTFLLPNVESLEINNQKSGFTSQKYFVNEKHYNLIITMEKVDVSKAVRLSINYKKIGTGTVLYGSSIVDSEPSDSSWYIGAMLPSQEITMPKDPEAKYILVAIPKEFKNIINGFKINDVVVNSITYDKTFDSIDYTLYISDNKFAANISNTLTLNILDVIGGNNEITFLDGLKGTEFMAAKIKSTDKSIRISDLGNGYADLSKGYGDHNEGIHVCLGNDELLNSKFGKAKLYFNDTRVKGGMFVYPDMDTKSFIIQDTDPTDDPNVSGGTTFIVALYYEPNPDEENIITQDGQISIELVDDNDIPITDTQGNPMGAIIDYKANDKVKPELYVGECKATAFTRVHLKIDLRFPNEEIISVGANTQLCIQSITKDETSGLALLSFMTYTGYQLQFDTKYYGYNSLNMAQFLTFDVSEDNTNAQQMQFGNNTYLDFKNNSKLSIVNNHLVIKDDGVNLPVWSIVKVYNSIDSKSIGGKSYKVTATLTDKDDAYRVTLLEYTGTLPAPIPTVLRYLNQNPVFTTGWVQRDSMFISEDAVSGDHTQSQTFVIPDNAKGLAIIMYHVESQIPVNLSLKDLEGDITPWFNRVIIRDNSHITEKYLAAKDGIYRSIVKTPNGDLAYRYTVNSTDTKIPVGVVSGNDDKIQNDHSWKDPGSIDPNQVQGDLKFLVDGKITMSYTARCFNEQGSINNIEFWVSKNVGGVFTEVPNSRTATTIEGLRTKPKMVSSFKFSFDVKANETYRMFAKSNKDDGFYLQSDVDGVPLFRTDIEFDEFTTTEKDIFDKTNEIKFISNGQEVYDKILQYDVQTGRMTVIDK